MLFSDTLLELRSRVWFVMKPANVYTQNDIVVQKVGFAKGGWDLKKNRGATVTRWFFGGVFGMVCCRLAVFCGRRAVISDFEVGFDTTYMSCWHLAVFCGRRAVIGGFRHDILLCRH